VQAGAGAVARVVHPGPSGRLNPLAKKLAELGPGERGRVTSVAGDADATRRLMDMGLIRGTTVEVVRRAPLGDPMEVKLRGFMLTLRRSEAEHITVE